MSQEYKDFVSANGGIEGQVAPTFISQPGALTTAGLAVVTAQFSTQTNPSGPSYGVNSVVQNEQNLAVSPFTYSAPGSRSAV